MLENPNKYYESLRKETVLCPICESNKFKTLHNNDRYGMGVQTVICNKCSLIYINPRPIEEEMSLFYKEHYRRFYESIEKPTVEYIKKGPFISRAEFVVKTLKAYLNKAESFIDVGCAEGTLLGLIEKENSSIDTYGIEPSINFGTYASENIKGEVFVGNYQEFIGINTNKKYDVLASTHVLEHILKPKDFLKDIKGLMHENSVLYIEVPNIMDQQVNGIGSIHIGHALSFDPETIQLLMQECGFEILELFTDNLPAKTPAMSVICKINNTIQVQSFPTDIDITNKKQKFINSIVGQKTKNNNERQLSSLLQRLKKKFLK